jgi:hypothetical protein
MIVLQGVCFAWRSEERAHKKDGHVLIHIVAPTSKSFISPCPFRPPHQNRRHLPRPTLMTPETWLRQTTSSDDSETSTTESDHVDTTSDLRSSRWTKQDYTILETPSRAARRLTVAPAPALSTSPMECHSATLTPASPATRRTLRSAAPGTRTSTPSTPATSLRSTTSFHGHPPSVPHTFPLSRDPDIFR